MNIKLICKFDDYILKKTFESPKIKGSVWEKFLHYLALKDIKKADKIISYIEKNIVKKRDGLRICDIGGNILSPYLDRGNALFVLLLLKYKEVFSSKKHEELMYDLLKGCKEIFIMKSSLTRGVSGIIYLLCKIFIETEKRLCLNLLINKLRYCSFFIQKEENCILIMMVHDYPEKTLMLLEKFQI